MTMLDKTDNDLPKANDENVSDKASIPNTKKEDETAETPSETSVETVTGKQVIKSKPNPEKQQEKTVETTDESAEAITDADKTKEADEASDEDVAAETESKQQNFDGMNPKEILAHFSEALSSKPIQILKGTVVALTKAFEKEMAILKSSQRQTFIDEGGNPDAFYFNPPVIKDFNNLVRRYKSDRGTY